MAQIDIKECTIKIWDGTPSVATLDSTPADSDLTFTTKSTHHGSKPVTVTFTDPGSASQSLTITVDNEDIDVSLATSTGSAITSTAALVLAAITGDADANALVSVAMETSGTGIVEAIAQTTLAGQNSMTVTIGEGNVTYSEKRPVEFTLDRGIIDTVRLADEEPMDVSMDFTWEFLSSQTGDSVPTLEEALKKTGLASSWISSSTDPCQPYSVDLEVFNNPVCGSAHNEIITIEEFYWESLDHDLRDGTVAVSGRANRDYATLARRA
jgi:hypothetical protein